MTSAAAQAERITGATDAVEGASGFASWPRALAVLGALGLAIGIAVLDAAPVGVAADDSMYVILAKSIATGQGYRFLNLPGAPAATHFPPGYPALLALLWRLSPEFPGNVVLFKAVNAVCLAVVAMAAAQLVRRRVASAGWAMALGVLAAVSVPLLVLSAMLLSELFFLALLLLLLPALENLVDDGARASAWHVAALGLAIGACMLVRTHAIVLVPAVALMLVARRRWRDAALVSGVAIACLLPWQLWSARHGGVLPRPLLGEYDSYTAWWVRGLREIGPSMIPATLRRTLGESVGMFAALFSPLRSEWAHVVTLAALAGLAVTGVAALRRRLPVTLLFLAGYLTIIALWPFAPSRFVWGVWPLLLLVLLCGAQAVVRALAVRGASDGRRRVLALAGAVAMAWVAWGYGAYEVRAVRGQWWASIPRANTRRIVPAVRWTLANTAPADVVAAEDDGAVYLYTGRRTVPVRTFTAQQYLTTSTPREEAEQGLAPVLAAYPVRHVVVGSSIALAAAQWLAAQPAPLVSPRDEFPGGAVFTVLSK